MHWFKLKGIIDCWAKFYFIHFIGSDDGFTLEYITQQCKNNSVLIQNIGIRQAIHHRRRRTQWTHSFQQNNNNNPIHKIQWICLMKSDFRNRLEITDASFSVSRKMNLLRTIRPQKRFLESDTCVNDEIAFSIVSGFYLYNLLYVVWTKTKWNGKTRLRRRRWRVSCSSNTAASAILLNLNLDLKQLFPAISVLWFAILAVAFFASIVTYDTPWMYSKFTYLSVH